MLVVVVTVAAADSDWGRWLWTAASDKWLWTSSPQLAKMADGCVNRNMTNMRKFGFSEYV